MRKFASIGAYRNAIHNVQKYCEHNNIPLPVVKYEGTVKLHGTNAGIRYENGKVSAQSRERTLTVDSDNYGFARWVEENQQELLDFFSLLFLGHEATGCTVYGEWCGKGIQQTVAVSTIDSKIFIPFAIQFDSEDWTDSAGQVHYIYRPMGSETSTLFYSLPTPETIEIDFNRPDLALDKLNALTDAYETECPFTKHHFNISGIGEGLVWRPVNFVNSSQFWFKTKGEKHGNPAVETKCKVSIAPEKFTELLRTAHFVCPDWRLEQGIGYLKDNNLPVTRESTGTYIKWVLADVKKEELDTMIASEFDVGTILQQVTQLAVKFIGNYTQ